MSQCISCVAINPTEWRRHMNDIVDDDEKKFSWFLCGKVIYDTTHKLYILEIPGGVQFYSPETGETYQVSKSKESGIRLLIMSDERNIPELKRKKILDKFFPPFEGNEDILQPSGSKNITNKICKTFGYDGFCTTHKCKMKNIASVSAPVCTEASFFFHPTNTIEKSDKCDIISYCKKNNSIIRRVTPEFPSCEEIDEVLLKFKKDIICRVLYEFVAKYLSEL